MEIRNFKAIQALDIDFAQETTIVGTNGVGKSSIFDAYTWLLYGKNSHDQQDFGIKTTDKDGNVIHKLEHSVTGFLDVDDQEITLRREYREKWQTKRGNDFEELTGHTTEYFIDQIPKSKSEFDTYVKDLISDSIAKVISNPLYFNEKMKWQERREILTSIAGDTTPEDVLNFAPDEFKNASELIGLLEARKSLTDEKTRIASERKRLKDKLDTIAPKIEELNNQSQTDLDKVELWKESGELITGIQAIEKQLENVAEQNKAEQLKVVESDNKLQALRDEYTKLRRELLTEHNGKSEAYNKRKHELRLEIQQLEFSISEETSKLKVIEQQIEAHAKQQADLKTKYEAEKTKEFTPVAENCPCCHRPMETSEQEQREKFNTAKANAMKQIIAEATDVKNFKEERQRAAQKIDLTLVSLNDQLKQKQTYLKEVEASFVVEQEPGDTSDMIALKKAIDSFVPYTPNTNCDTQALKLQRDNLNDQLAEVNKKIASLEFIAQIGVRIAELEEQRRTLSQEIANLERIVFQIEAYEKAHIELVESRVNRKFALVKWKMFDEQINGGLAPTCEATVNGVSYNDLNTASKINTGLDVINALNYHFEVFAPVFIDCRESIVDIINVDFQVVSLQVDKAYEKLTVII